MSEPKRMRVHHIMGKKDKGEKIAMLTGYDYAWARLLDEAGVDIILVGDSLGNVILGYETTLPVTLADIVHHAKAVRRGTKRAMVVVDMPFMTFQTSVSQGIENAGRIMQETGADAVKIEGGQRVVPLVKELTAIGIPVMGHLGMTPQSVHQFGGFRVQGRGEGAADALAADAVALEQAGAFSIVLELVPTSVAEHVTRSVRIPTIGIGAGPHCDGQVLVTHDMLGMFDDFRPSFVKQFASIGDAVRKAVGDYVAEVGSGQYPGAEHSFDD